MLRRKRNVSEMIDIVCASAYAISVRISARRIAKKKNV